MEDIKLVEAYNLEIDKAEPNNQDSVLNFVLKLQNQLCIESLLTTFDECIRSIHDISGVRYRYPLLAVTHQIGNQNKQQQQLHLEVNNEFLGDITIYHDSSLDSSTHKSIELIATLLSHPLRSLIKQKASSLLACSEETIGIANVELVEQLITREAKLAQREHVPMSLILLDIDRFESITDQHGFITRDEVLYQVLQVMRSNIRDTDLLFRYEGDTYCLILKGVCTKNALEISERIRRSIDAFKFDINNINLSHITISNGITELKSNDSIESIFSRATHAMQHAKKMGRNQSIVADGKFIS